MVVAPNSLIQCPRTPKPAQHSLTKGIRHRYVGILRTKESATLATSAISHMATKN